MKEMPRDGDTVEVVLVGQASECDGTYFDIGEFDGSVNCITMSAEHVKSVRIIGTSYEIGSFYRTLAGSIVQKTRGSWRMLRYADGNVALGLDTDTPFIDFPVTKLDV